MDNLLTPKKIQRLINLAEDRSFNAETRRMLLTEEDVKLIASHAVLSKSPAKYESSSGILDLEHVEAFGENGSIANMSLSKSTAFNPSEMTGRSTGAEEMAANAALAVPSDEYRRHSLANINNIENEMNKQTSEIQDIMRHSIASNYSFHSKRDLTADEASLIAREAPLPVPHSTHLNFPDMSSTSNSNLSVGAYFKNRCLEFGKILGKTDSPDKSTAMPSITEVSGNTPFEYNKETSPVVIDDDALDCVPVRQPRNANSSKMQMKQQLSHPIANIGPEKQNQLKTELATPRTVTTEPSASKPIKPANVKTGPPHLTGHKSFMMSSKPTDVLLKNLHSSFRLITDDTEGSVENSFSLSKIADFLGKQSNLSVTDIMQLNQKRPHKKPPLTELHMNTQEKMDQEVQVTNLIDSRKAETASSAGTVNTVISLDKLKIKERDIPEVIVTRHSYGQDDLNIGDIKRATRSKSPSSKSPSSLSTVRENYSSFKSSDTPNSSRGEANRSKLPSPNIVYKELDKSVDWQDVLEQKRSRVVAKEQWAEIVAPPVEGFVGVSCAATITVTTLTDSWLTAKFQFDELPHDGKDLNLELPRLPLLLSPRKSENFTFHITANVEMNSTIPFTVCLKDASIDGDIEQKGELKINFKMPIIQAMSADGMNKVIYPPIQEKMSVCKSFVLISDCPVDLQLKLSIVEGDSMFYIKNVQEIKKSDVNKVLLERQGLSEEHPGGKQKSKAMNKQLCRLTSGNAIRVSIAFKAPKLAEQQSSDSKMTVSGVLSVNLITSNTVLRKVDLVGIVGTAKLAINTATSKVHLSNEPVNVFVCNTGSIPGIWMVKCKTSESSFPFKVSPSKFELQAGAKKPLSMAYIGPEDSVSEATLIFEDIASGFVTYLEISGGTEQKSKIFPIRTNHSNLSWVRPGRKEISLKNSTDKKVPIRCQILGDGFSIDLPGGEMKGVYVLMSFEAYECRPLPISFTPTSSMPQSAMLHLAYDKNNDVTRKVRLWGCASAEAARWSGLVTYSDTALLRAAPRAPIDLKLYNKAVAPVFVAARVHFNLQYMSVEATSRLVGALRVVGGRAHHTVSLLVDWTRVERRARECATTALATVTVLTGAEFTRRRILKVLKDECNGELNTSLLPDHLKVLAEPFEGEDASMDNVLAQFMETKSSLPELIGGLQELTAHIDLPQDFADENTIIISDDTIIDHHTLCE